MKNSVDYLFVLQSLNFVLDFNGDYFIDLFFFFYFRLRVEHMERQLANLTGLVQKALTQTPVVASRDYLSVPTPRDAYRALGNPF